LMPVGTAVVERYNADGHQGAVLVPPMNSR
jgi:hypothetical protein